MQNKSILSLLGSVVLALQISFVLSSDLLSQSLTNYTFAASSGTYTALASATGAGHTGYVDNYAYNGIPIGFNFVYMGIPYTTVSFSGQGWMTFGQDINIATAATVSLTSGGTRPVIAPLWGNTNPLIAGYVSYKTTGTTGSKIFTLEAFSFQWVSNGALISYQIKLYEATGAVQFVYKQENATVGNGTAAIGITAAATGTGNFLSLNGTGTAPTASSTTQTSNLTVKPATGQTYTFTPPAIPTAPTVLNFTAVSDTGMTLNWTDNSSNETGYSIWRSVDNTNFTWITTVASNTTTYAANGLVPEVTYYWQVRTMNEGRMSAALSGSKVTNLASYPLLSHYTYAASTGTYTALTGATTAALNSGNLDEGAYNRIPIGFTFLYMGNIYNTVSFSTNGWMTFGQNITSYARYNSLTSGGTRPLVAPLWDDNDMTSGTVSYLTQGTAGSRIFTLQASNVEWSYLAIGGVISFQIKLYEATGAVVFVYKQESVAVNSGTASIGITATDINEGNFLSLDISDVGSSWTEFDTKYFSPATGKTYTFTPRTVPTAPTTLSFTSVGASGMTLNWLDKSTNETGFAIYSSIDNTNFTYVTEVGPNLTSYIATGLIPETKYYWQVMAMNEGRISSALTGFQTTNSVSYPLITRYAFTATSGTYTALSGATTATLSSGWADNGAYNAIPIGFTFIYSGTPYSTVSFSTQGWMAFDKTLSYSDNGLVSLPNEGVRPIVAPLWDINAMTSGTLSYLTQGIAGSRIFTLQASNVEWCGLVTGGVISFQVKLYEATGAVVFVYKQESAAVLYADASIGITAADTGIGKYLSLTNSGTSPFASPITATTGIITKPADGQTYTFTPPTTVPTAPTSLNFTSVGTIGMTLNWTDNSSNETGFAIWRSTDNVTFTFVAVVNANVSTYAATGLSPASNYYWQVRAVTDAKMSTAISGLQPTIPEAIPTVSTQSVSNIGIFTATGNGTVSSLGTSNLTQYGHCWNISGSPTISDSKTELGVKSSTGTFTSNIAGLIGSTTYYVKAYATSSVGTAYGSQVSFTTLQSDPVLAVNGFSPISSTSATVLGSITTVGSPAPTHYGFCWNTTTTPTISNSKTDLGAVSQTGNFSSDLTGLTVGTTYYVRAYATNAVNTYYGPQQTFVTFYNFSNADNSIGGTALNFNGTSNYGIISSNINSTLDGASQFTIESWVFARTLADLKTIFSKSTSANACIAIQLSSASSVGNDDFLISVCNGASSYGTTNTNIISVNKWNHIAVIYNGSGAANADKLKLYVNGVQQTLTFTGTIPSVTASGATAYLGSTGGTSLFWDGKIDEFRIWNTARTESQIRETMDKEIPATTGLKAYYLMSEGLGTSLNDYSGNGNNVTLYGSPVFKASGCFSGTRNSLLFDGTSSYISLPAGVDSLIDNKQTFTFCGWIYPTNLRNWNIIFDKTNGTNEFGVMLSGSSRGGTDEILIVHSVGSYLATSAYTTSNILTINNWYHIAIVLDGTQYETLKLYVNGQQQNLTSTSTVQATFPPGGVLTIGKKAVFSNIWQGNFDEFSFWNVALSQSSIREMMNRNLSGKETGLVAYYKFNNVSGGTELFDYSPNNLHGTTYNLSTAWQSSSIFNSWTGAESVSWSSIANWSNGSIPASTDNVGIYKYSFGYDATLSGSPTLNNLFISSGSTLSFNSGITINNKLTLEKDFNLNGQILTLGASGLLDEGSYRLFGLNGYITTTRNLSNISAMNVGGLGAVITTTDNMGSTEIRRSHNEINSGGHKSILRNYTITPSNNSGLSATLVFNYNENELNSISEANLKLFESTDGISWLLGGGTVNTTNNTVTLAGIPSFSTWTLGDVNSPLPVELQSFTVKTKNNKVQLAWNTATEVNNYGFEIERQQEPSETWQTIGFVHGSGNSNSPMKYMYTDSILFGERLLYRLKMIDTDGKFTYSETVSIAPVRSTEYKLRQNYPNPFNPSTTISYSLPKDGKVTLAVYDVLGLEVATLVNEYQIAGDYEAVFGRHSYPSGVYICRISYAGTTQSIRMVLMK